ncbi:phasin family protein [Paraburkholderia mimosarum]|uniref:phasin family protein n=1 Tax=Paraburkholderia mimosarum TaxID=312026 RepID=UPI000687DCA5|nr:phasin family protein [Paraburkholderia mimosarum]
MIQPIVEVQMASVDALFNLAVTMVNAAERLTQLAFVVARSMLAQAENTALGVLRSSEPGRSIPAQARATEPTQDTAASNMLQLFDIATSTQAEFNRYAQTQVDVCKEQVQTFIDQITKNVPAGPEATFSARKSAVETTHSLNETMQKSYEQAVEVARSDLAAVSSTEKTTRHATGQASPAARQRCCGT